MVEDYKLLKLFDEFIKIFFIKNGIKFKNEDNLQMKFFNFLSKQVASQKIKIKISKEFKYISEHYNEFMKIKTLISKGRDISKYMSSRINEAHFKDLMYNDWGIHHLHFKNIDEGRTGELLFVYFTDDTAYFIQTGTHESWSEVEFLNIMNDNWPELCNKFIYNGEHKFGDITTDDDVKQARKNKSLMLYTLNDRKIIIPPNHGMASSGDSNNTVRWMDSVADWIMDYEDEQTKNKELNIEDFYFDIKGDNVVLVDMKANEGDGIGYIII